MDEPIASAVAQEPTAQYRKQNIADIRAESQPSHQADGDTKCISALSGLFLTAFGHKKPPFVIESF